MEPHAVQSVAENQALADVGIVKWLNTEMVPRAEQPPASPIPDRKGKVSQQLLYAGFPPGLIGAQDQLRVRRRLQSPLTFHPQLLDQLGPAIDARIGSDPYLPVQACWLPLAHGLVRGAQHRVAETHRARGPALLRIRPAVGHEFG